MALLAQNNRLLLKNKKFSNNLVKTGKGPTTAKPTTWAQVYADPAYIQLDNASKSWVTDVATRMTLQYFLSNVLYRTNSSGATIALVVTPPDPALVPHTYTVPGPLCCYLSLNCCSAPATPAGPLKVAGNVLKDGCGNAITLHGVNLDVEKAWWNNNWQQNLTMLSDISSTTANAVRISWWAKSTNGAAGAYTLDKLDAYLQKCKDLKLVPVLELHDLTTQNNYTNFTSTIMGFWTRADVKQVLQKYQNYLIINFANEFGYVAWGGSVTDYTTAYKNAIATMRSNGYTCPLLIDAPDGGASEDVLLANCNALFAADNLANTLFSVHSYWIKYNGQAAKINTQITSMKNSGHVFLLGELANQQDEVNAMCKYNLDAAGSSIMETVLNAAKTNNIGWLAWEWYNDACPNRQLTTSGNSNSLTPQGTKIINSTVFGIKSYTNVRAKTTCP